MYNFFSPRGNKTFIELMKVANAKKYKYPKKGKKTKSIKHR